MTISETAVKGPIKGGGIRHGGNLGRPRFNPFVPEFAINP